MTAREQRLVEARERRALAAIQVLTDALDRAQRHILEMGCTCAGPHGGPSREAHHRQCSGVGYAKESDPALRTGLRLLNDWRNA